MAKRKTSSRSIHIQPDSRRTGARNRRQDAHPKNRDGDSGFRRKHLRFKVSPDWFSWLALAAVCLLLFYPPYFRGLFFDKELLPTHVITAIIYALVWVDKFRRRDLRFIQNPLDWAALAYAGAYLLSLFGAVHIGDAIKGFLKALNYFMVYWMVTQVVRDYKTYETVLRVLFASALGVAAIGIAAATGFSHYPGAFENGQILSTLQYCNTTAVYMGVMSIIGITLWLREGRLFFKLSYGLSTAAMVLVAIAAVSKGGWIVLILGSTLLLVGMPGVFRIKAAYLLASAFGAAIVGAVQFTPAISSGNTPMAFRGLAAMAIAVIVLQLVWEGLIACYRRLGGKAAVGIGLLVCVVAFTQVSLEPKTIERFLPSRLISEAKEVGDEENFSYVSRLEFKYTALRIVKDHPLVGTGAGGWNALYHQYLGFPFWTTEVHDHFLQVWVEAGTLGFLAFVSMWGLLLYNLWRLYRARSAREEWAMNWGVASAALAFGAHSAIDFDLSLAAMAMVLWSLFALVASGCRISVPETAIKRLEPAWIKTAAASLILILLVPGASFARAYGLVNSALVSANKRQIDRAEEGLRRAVNLNPWEGTSYAYLAKVLAVKYQALQQNKHPAADQYRTLALRAAGKAERVRPYDIKTLRDVQQVYSIIGDGKNQLRVLEQALKTNPMDPVNYVNVASGSVVMVKYYLDEGNQKEAFRYIEKALQASDDLDRKAEAVSNTYPQFASQLTRLPTMDLAVGQAYFLSGRYPVAIAYLENAAAKDTSLASEANTWKAAALFKTGQKEAANRLISQVTAQDAKYRTEYESLVKVKPVRL